MNKKLIYGKGINDANYVIRKCPIYRKWFSLLTRCFDKKYQNTHPTYIGCTICDEWLLFSNFKNWMLSQNWENNQLDKDLIKKGNKHYSPELCCFIPQEINLLFNENKAKGNMYGIGVSITKFGKFQAKLNKHPKKIHIGTFSTAREAEIAYLRAKGNYLIELSNDFSGKIKEGLINHANYYFSICL